MQVACTIVDSALQPVHVFGVQYATSFHIPHVPSKPRICRRRRMFTGAEKARQRADYDMTEVAAMPYHDYLRLDMLAGMMGSCHAMPRLAALHSLRPRVLPIKSDTQV